MCDLLEKYLESRGSKLLVFNSFTIWVNYEKTLFLQRFKMFQYLKVMRN